MENRDANAVPQVSTDFTVASDRVKASVVNAGHMDFGEGQAWKKTEIKP